MSNVDDAILFTNKNFFNTAVARFFSLGSEISIVIYVVSQPIKQRFNGKTARYFIFSVLNLCSLLRKDIE
jgi:hypothetical protein